MNQKPKLGLIAVILSCISTISILGGISLSSNYHCDDPNWLSKSEYKNGAYIAENIYLKPLQACLHQTSGIYLTVFFGGLMLPWTMFAIFVGIWRGDVEEQEFKEIPMIQNLCKIHFNEMVTKFMYVQKFQIQYKDNLGKCSLCPRDATCQFIKNETPKRSAI